MSKKCVSLIRVSTELQTESNGGTSLPIQREKLTDYAKMNSYDLIGTYEDVYSGGYESRMGIEKVKDLVKNGQVDVVLVYKCDRLFRSMLAFSKFYELLKKYDVELVSVSEGLSSKNETASLVFNLMMSVAQYEKSTIVNRLSSGRHYKAKNGIRGFGGVVPFGYKRTTKGEVVVDTDNSRAVQYIYKKVNQLKSSKMTKTKKTQHILKLLKQKGYKFNGQDFDCYKLRRILSNPFYIGVLNYGSTSSLGSHQAIVSKRLYNAVQNV